MNSVTHKGHKFTKTNALTLKGEAVYKKNGVSTYYSMVRFGPGGTPIPLKFIQIFSDTKVKKANGTTMMLKNYKKNSGTKPAIFAPVVAAPAAAANTFTHKGHVYTKTNIKTLINGKNVYKKKNMSTYYTVTNGAPKLISTSTHLKLSNGTSKSLKNYKKSGSTPKPAATAAPSPKPVLSLVPIIKPGPDHVKTLTSVHESTLEKVAEKLKELHGANATNAFNNYKKARGNMGFVHMNRKNTLHFKVSTIQGTHPHSTTWKDSLKTPKFKFIQKNFTLSYTQYLAHQQLLFLYGKNVNSFENVRMSDMIDTKWFVAQDKYIRSLTSRQLFTMYGFTYNGDVWAHTYLDKTFNFAQFKSGVPSVTSGVYFAFFFQARDFYKINTGNITTDYSETINRVKSETDVKNINCIINMFINELNEIIRKSPSVTKTFIVFRGVKNDTYLSGAVDGTYTSERFCSSSINGNVAHGFSNGHALQRITLLRGSKCLLMIGPTKYNNEFEILLPRGATYKIVRKRSNITQQANTNLLRSSFYSNKSVTNLVDIVMLGTVEPAQGVVAVTVS